MSIDMWMQLGLATWQTIAMVLLAGVIAVVVGMPFGVFLVVTRDRFFSTHITLHRLIALVVNVVRSVPFIILLVAITPLTRVLVGTSIGTAAAMVPLAISAIPFYARIVEASLKEVPEGLKEAAVAMGATPLQIIYKVLLPESFGSLIRGATLTLITLIGYSAMAGAVGGGGLGDLAIRYGYQRFEVDVMVWTVVVLIIMVQLLQWLGDSLARRCEKA